MWSYNSNKNPRWDWPTMEGTRLTKTAWGTCFPAPVSLKKVLKESSPPPIVLSEGIWPSSNSMLQAIEFPTGITDLDTGLANMHRNTFPLQWKVEATYSHYWLSRTRRTTLPWYPLAMKQIGQRSSSDDVTHHFRLRVFFLPRSTDSSQFRRGAQLKRTQWKATIVTIAPNKNLNVSMRTWGRTDHMKWWMHTGWSR